MTAENNFKHEFGDSENFSETLKTIQSNNHVGFIKELTFR